MGAVCAVHDVPYAGRGCPPNFMAFRKREFPRLFPSGTYPPNTLLIVNGLVRDAFLVEVHTIAAL